MLLVINNPFFPSFCILENHFPRPWHLCAFLWRCVFVNVIPRNIKEKFLVVSAGSGSLLFNNIWTLGFFPLSIVSRAVCSSTADTTLLCSSSVGCGWVVCPMCTLSLSTHCCQHFYRSSNVLPVYFVNAMIIFIQFIILSPMHDRENVPTLLPAKRFPHSSLKPIQPWQGSCWKIIGLFSYSGWANVMWWRLIHIMGWGRPQENILEVNRSIFPLNICWMWTYMIHTSCISGKGLTRTQEVKSPKTEIYSMP